MQISMEVGELQLRLAKPILAYRTVKDCFTVHLSFPYVVVPVKKILQNQSRKNQN